jgi:hypothetical protein
VDLVSIAGLVLLAGALWWALFATARRPSAVVSRPVLFVAVTIAGGLGADAVSGFRSPTGHLIAAVALVAPALLLAARRVVSVAAASVLALAAQATVRALAFLADRWSSAGARDWADVLFCHSTTRPSAAEVQATAAQLGLAADHPVSAGTVSTGLLLAHLALTLVAGVVLCARRAETDKSVRPAAVA